MYIISLFPNLHTPFSPSLISLVVSVDVKHLFCVCVCVLLLNSPRRLTSCVEEEVDVLGSPSLIVCAVSVDVKQHWQMDHNFKCQNR